MQASQQGSTKSSPKSRKGKSPKASAALLNEDGTKKDFSTKRMYAREKDLNTLFVTKESVPTFTIMNRKGPNPHNAAHVPSRFVPLVKEIERTELSGRQTEPFHVAA